MKRKVPSFWWDFNRDTTCIVVESDSDKYPVIATFTINDDADDRILEAENMIAEMKSGRLTIKQAMESKDENR